MKGTQQMDELSMDGIAKALEAYRKDEGRSMSAQERLSQVMGIWGTTFNIMGAFAAPRVLAKLPAKLPVERETMHKQILGIFDDYIELITGEKSGEKFNGEDFHRTLEPARRARALLAAWVASEEAPAPLVQAARDFFASFGRSEPEGGWDTWEGPPQDSATC
jgi:hypothetical protein